MARPPKPEFLVQYEQWVALGPPRCCHTCDAYTPYGWCVTFNTQPPNEFVALQDSCPCWERVCPF
jgi:hypothetical protein